MGSIAQAAAPRGTPTRRTATRPTEPQNLKRDQTRSRRRTPALSPPPGRVLSSYVWRGARAGLRQTGHAYARSASSVSEVLTERRRIEFAYRVGRHKRRTHNGMRKKDIALRERICELRE